MAQFRAGIIGCGGMSKAHAVGYNDSPDCELVAVADIAEDKLAAFCELHAVERTYGDYREMLAREALDIVSVVVWPALHAPIVLDAAEAGVRAIHCEKPMASTWAAARQMVAACDAAGVQLTFNHQRRYGRPFVRAKELLDEGAIGELTRLEAFTHNLYDWGTHWFNMLFYYNDDVPARWVMGQIEARGSKPVFGMMCEGQGLSFFQWENGVFGLVMTGQPLMKPESDAAQATFCSNRIIGTEGTIEVGLTGDVNLRLQNGRTGGHWMTFDEGTIHGLQVVSTAIVDVVDGLKTGRETRVAAQTALQSTEVMFATYESSRRRGRVDLPLEIDDHPFLDMLASGAVSTGE
jgi:UDP-N-acetylglucosamine 3-dehydrogenase